MEKKVVGSFIRIAACLMVGGFISQASAETLSPAAPSASLGHEMILAQYMHPDERRMQDRRPPPRGPQFDRDRRYKGPPPGWRRYHDRPRDWRVRRCTQLGPVWYCP
jgi:hypothetical protein